MSNRLVLGLNEAGETPVLANDIVPSFYVIGVEYPAFFLGIGDIAGLGDKKIKLFESDFGRSHVVAVVDSDFMLGQLIRPLVLIDVVMLASHDECAGIDANQVKVNVADSQCKPCRIGGTSCSRFACFLCRRGRAVSSRGCRFGAAYDSKARVALPEETVRAVSGR